jgi:hypothetical protein
MQRNGRLDNACKARIDERGETRLIADPSRKGRA